MVAATRVTITGKVQGVFFRAWTRQQAEAFGVTGWVRNCADGSVEAHLEGAEAARAALIERLRVGPPGARVDNVSVTASTIEGSAGFAIRH